MNSQEYQSYQWLPYWVMLMLCISIVLLADVDEWVPKQLIQTAKQNHGNKASQKIKDWRKMLQQARYVSESKKLEQVNRFFNNNVPYKDDKQHFKAVDYWATPYESLVKLGVDTSKLRITYVNAVELNQAHMVLAYFAHPDGIPLVLDNLIASIKPASERSDLDPVYSFNAEGMWLDQMKGRGVLMGNPNKLDMWTDLRIRMNNLGMDL